MRDCRNCIEWKTCPCGKSGHDKGTSIGYSVGECKDYKPTISNPVTELETRIH